MFNGGWLVAAVIPAGSKTIATAAPPTNARIVVGRGRPNLDSLRSDMFPPLDRPGRSNVSVSVRTERAVTTGAPHHSSIDAAAPIASPPPIAGVVPMRLCASKDVRVKARHSTVRVPLRASTISWPRGADQRVTFEPTIALCGAIG